MVEHGRARVQVIVGIALVLVPAFAACGGKDSADTVPPPDASTSAADADVMDGAQEGSALKAVAACFDCFANRCGDPVEACFGEPTCKAAFQCFFGTCLVGQNANAACFEQCLMGDNAAANLFVSTATCVGLQCSDACKSAVDAIGAIGGILGGPRDGGRVHDARGPEDAGGSTGDAGPDAPIDAALD
jgi:hypothetical protein